MMYGIQGWKTWHKFRDVKIIIGLSSPTWSYDEQSIPNPFSSSPISSCCLPLTLPYCIMLPPMSLVFNYLFPPFLIPLSTVTITVHQPHKQSTSTAPTYYPPLLPSQRMPPSITYSSLRPHIRPLTVLLHCDFIL